MIAKKRRDFAMTDAKKKILLVDDDPDFVGAIRVMLEVNGFEVAVAHDGREGLEKAGEFHPDLIVLDMMMPVMNGREACRRLKSDPATKKIPVILLTGIADHVTTTPYTHRDVLDSDAEEYISKPVQNKLLLETIKSLL
jgi:two-component system, OmpR family, alkaline phosphatase synthesis response regulator PhoP